MCKKKYCGLILIAFISISFTLLQTMQTIGNSSGSNAGTLTVSAGSSTASLKYTTVTVASNSFYASLGTVYNTVTSDKVNIRVLRYHPAGSTFNTGAQPILLLPGMGCNINTFLTQVTPRIAQLYPNITLPVTLASWAQNDVRIKNNPLLYYSLAYYLWKSGYDVWLLNYRGVGMDEMKSGFGTVKTTDIDQFALYDADAGINLVYQVTGQHPVLCGHSTGGVCAMMLLQGCYFKSDGMVGSTTSLVQQRNGKTASAETIKGFIGLEPAGIPIVTSALNNLLVWAILDSGIDIDARSIVTSLDKLGQLSVTNLISQMISVLGSTSLGTDLGSYLNLDYKDITPYLTYYFLLYCPDTMYITMVAQYADWAWKNTIRECFWDGFWNSLSITDPTPSKGDGFYYYIDNAWSTNMPKWSVPSLFFLGNNYNTVFCLVNGSEIIKDYYGAKTPNAYDAYYTVEASHIDIPFGLNAPTSIFPNIGSWLAQVG